MMRRNNLSQAGGTGESTVPTVRITNRGYITALVDVDHADEPNADDTSVASARIRFMRSAVAPGRVDDIPLGPEVESVKFI